MAELVLKIGTVGPDPAYQDGDIVSAFNDHRIQCCHAEVICLPRDQQGRKPVDHKGFRQDPLGLARTFFNNAYQYRFERVSKKEVKRILLSDMSEDLISDVPNDNGEYMDVHRFVRDRRAYAAGSGTMGAGKAIFGAPGKEVWYGGHVSVSPASLDVIWNAIETHTPRRRSDHSAWPLTEREKMAFLAISVDNFDGEEMVRMVSPGRNDSGDVYRKRMNFVGFRDLNVPVPIKDIDNRKVPVDIRGRQSFLRAVVVREKG